MTSRVIEVTNHRDFRRLRRHSVDGSRQMVGVCRWLLGPAVVHPIHVQRLQPVGQVGTPDTNIERSAAEDILIERTWSEVERVASNSLLGALEFCGVVVKPSTLTGSSQSSIAAASIAALPNSSTAYENSTPGASTNRNASTRMPLVCWEAQITLYHTRPDPWGEAAPSGLQALDTPARVGSAVEINRDLQRSEVFRSQDDVLTAGETWKKAMIEKS